MKINDSEIELSPTEIREMVDAGARARLGVSGEDMITRYRAGELEDVDAVADLLALVSLLEPAVAA